MNIAYKIILITLGAVLIYDLIVFYFFRDKLEAYHKETGKMNSGKDQYEKSIDSKYSHTKMKDIHEVDYTKCITCGKRKTCSRLRCDGYIEDSKKNQVEEK